MKRAYNGIRHIKGQEYFLAGREQSKDDARRKAEALREYWQQVRVIKLGMLDYRIYVHAAR